MDLIANTIQTHVAYFDLKSNEYKYLVLKRAEDSYIYRGLWQVITGRIEKTETAVDAAMRELTEETGIIADKLWSLPYVALFHNHRRNAISGAPCFGVIAKSEDVVLSNEHSDYLWLYEHDCLNQLVLPSHREGTKIFKEYILESTNNDIYLINHNL